MIKFKYNSATKTLTKMKGRYEVKIYNVDFADGFSFDELPDALAYLGAMQPNANINALMAKLKTKMQNLTNIT